MKSDINKDPVEFDDIFPPDIHSLFIEDRLLGLIYIANGKGPHKTVLLLHGFPGNEKNFDLAHALRRGGYNVIIFHYSGSWGSRGKYSFSQNYLDLHAVRSAIADEAFAKEHRIDKNNVFLAGHSVGGFLTVLAARNGMDFCGFAALAPYNISRQAERIETKDREAYAETFGLLSGGLKPLNGATAESLMSDIIKNGKDWNLLGNPKAYRDKKMLLVMASGDRDATPAIHQIPVAEVLGAAEDSKTIVTFSCSHDFSEKRIALAETVYEWLCECPYKTEPRAHQK